MSVRVAQFALVSRFHRPHCTLSPFFRAGGPRIPQIHGLQVSLWVKLPGGATKVFVCMCLVTFASANLRPPKFNDFCRWKCVKGVDVRICS
ncbi:hypothetical protein FIBSPDRAFT_98142 [Athelia psychrophila]|uniref:Uncharacterized protein n=1 Tax=Athelia psychrophila TaxID=1759441 RepID=A0A166DQB9_9AGAM|nr:hypothetical protein FIBSPDRAFT_98142 [Fibularhizoctonia sp. CBS 109695]